MEQVRLGAVWPVENRLGSSLNHIQGWTTVRESYSPALEQGPPIFTVQFQDVGMRERTREVYKMYSRRSAAEVHAAVAALGARYLVLAGDWCNRPHA